MPGDGAVVEVYCTELSLDSYTLCCDRRCCCFRCDDDVTETHVANTYNSVATQLLHYVAPSLYIAYCVQAARLS